MGEVGKGEERWFISPDDVEERMEDDAEEVRTSVGMGGGGYFGMKLLLLCRLEKAGETGELEDGVRGSGFE